MSAPGAGRLHVAALSFGLGDLVVSLPAVQALVADGVAGGDDVVLVARSPVQVELSTRVPGLAGAVDEATFDPRSSGGRFVDLRDHPLQRDHWWGSAEFESAFGPLSINDILGRICSDFGVDARFDRPVPLQSNPRSDVADLVLLVAGADGPAKRWPLEHWVALAESVRGAGLDVRLVTKEPDDPGWAGSGIATLCAPTPGDAVDVLGSCRAVVGVDTGLSHLAVQQGTPTVTLFRPRPVYFRPWPHTRAVVGGPCDEGCEDLDRRRAYNGSVSLRGLRWTPPSCVAGGRCMSSIHPERVADALFELL